MALDENKRTTPGEPGSVSGWTRGILGAGFASAAAWGAVLVTQGHWFGWAIFVGGLLVISVELARPETFKWHFGAGSERLLQVAGGGMILGSIASIALGGGL